MPATNLLVGGSLFVVRGEIARGERGGEPPGAARRAPSADCESPNASSPAYHQAQECENQFSGTVDLTDLKGLCRLCMVSCHCLAYRLTRRKL